MLKQLGQRRYVPEGSVTCLTCASEDPRNGAAKLLRRATCALSIDGILAAILVADGEDYASIVGLARAAIAEERDLCRENGPFRSDRCGAHGLAALQRKSE